jgi:hypothetical protein
LAQFTVFVCSKRGQWSEQSDESVVLAINHPVRRGEDTVQSFKRCGVTTITPGKATAHELQLFNRHPVDEASEAAHATTVKATRALVSFLVDHVEVPAQ